MNLGVILFAVAMVKMHLSKREGDSDCLVAT